MYFTRNYANHIIDGDIIDNPDGIHGYKAFDEDWACFDVNRPTFVKIRNHFGHIVLMKLAPISIYERMDMDSTSIYADNRVYHRVYAQPTITIEAEFKAQPFRHALTNKTVLSIDIDPEKADEDAKRAILLGLKE